jgi:putative transposase
LSELCHYSKNLWNEANYLVRQAFFAGNRIPKYSDLAGTFKTSDNYQAINAKTGQQILRVLSKSWKGFFKAVKDYAKHPEKYLGEPRIPGYKEKDGEFILIFTNQQVSIEDG